MLSCGQGTHVVALCIFINWKHKNWYLYTKPKWTTCQLLSVLSKVIISFFSHLHIIYHATGRLLVGVGKVLRIYDMGKKKILRKCENKSFPNMITAIHTQGDRIGCTDVQESIHFIKYKRSENSLYVSSLFIFTNLFYCVRYLRMTQHLGILLHQRW